MEVSPHSVWSILVLAQCFPGVTAFTSAPTQGPLPLASAQKFSSAPPRQGKQIIGDASVRIVRATTWRMPRKQSVLPIYIDNMRLVPRLRTPLVTEMIDRPQEQGGLWVVDFP